MTTIPRAASEFTPEWLTDVLRASGHISDARVVAVGPSSLGEGFGLLGSLTRLSLGYDRHEPSAPESLVAKFPAIAEMNRGLARQYRVYEREHRFYADVAARIATRVPRCYFSHFEPETLDAVILLEDLAPATVGDQLVPPTDAEVTAAVEEMAKLHTAWWGKPETAALTWAPYLNDPVWMQVGDSMGIFIPTFRAQLGHLITPTIEPIVKRFAEAIPELLTRLSQPPTTLIHGDFRLDNLFFRPDGLTVIDWQLISRGRSAYDLAYFMSQSLPPEQRARIEMEELRRYHALLADGGVRSYSFDDCFNDYRLATLACLMYPLAAGGGIDLGNERGVALATAFATRSFAAVEHLHAGTLMPA